MDVHRHLGKGLLEIVYKDALEHEFNLNNINYSREKEYAITYKGVTLSHKFYADFIIEDKIILEIKCCKNFADEHFSQVTNYLAISKCAVGLIVNFGTDSLQTKRLKL